ncbi:protein Spindly-like [Planococcus citri]|uniref:protein Spindly-like n=1 Tax=Planococcus citri TaxID=170843 RepID=UPI0031FA3CBD
MKKKFTQEELLNQNIKIEELETSNKVLLEKMKLLKIQLESQNNLYTSAFHPRSAQSHRSHSNLFHRNYNINGFHGKDSKHDDSNKTAINKQYDSLFQQMHVLQEELENVKQQNKDRICELEEQLAKVQEPVSPGKLKTELDDNVELIKLKRLTKKQTAQIQSLTSQLEIANSDIKQLQTNLLSLNNLNETLQNELSQEKLETTKLSSNIETLKDAQKLLEAQINDLQAEKNTLKEHNDNLLKLSLQKEPNTDTSERKANYLRQIKELEENLRKEVVAKSEALSKLADSEIENIKLQNELSKCNVTITEMKTNNTMLREQIDNLKEIIDKIQLKTTFRHNSIPTEDKSIMVSITDQVDAVCSKSNLEELINVTDVREGPDGIKMKLYQVSSELNQCKELLRVQYALNNKNKTEIEELQKIYQKNEKTVLDCSRNLQNMLRKHEERLSQLNDAQLVETNFKNIFSDLQNSTKFKKSHHQDYVNVLDKLLNSYNVVVRDLKSKFSPKVVDKKDVQVGVSVQCANKMIQTEEYTISTEKVEENAATEIQKTSSITKSPSTTTAVFELQFGEATFTYFSEHLKRSTENNPKIFLTWNFMDDNEHQAYTPTISVAEGKFNCSCQYEGPWSKALYEYLKQHGINIEIHLVQGDISVRLAEGKVDTGASIHEPNVHHRFTVSFENSNIKGNVTGGYTLTCEESAVQRMV